MTPVNGRIELRLRKGDGSMGERCHQRVDQPIWGADASRPSRCSPPGTFSSFSLTRFWAKGSLPLFNLGAYCIGP